MNEVYNAILARRSVRNFKDEKVPREKILPLLQAAMAAPSACNLQPWEFIVVDEPETLQKLKEAAALGRYNAPLAIVICGRNDHIPWKGDGWQFDIGAAAQNLMLECVEQGLASVCIGGFDHAAITELLEIPDGIHPLVIIEIGYAQIEKTPCTWYTEEAVSWQKYNREKNRSMRTVAMVRQQMAEEDSVSLI